MSTWTAPQTWTPDPHTVSAAELDTHIRDNFNAVHPNALSKSATYTVVTSDGHTVFIKMDATGAARTVNLYTAVGNTGAVIGVQKTDSSTNAVTIDPNGAQTIHTPTATTLVLIAQGDYAFLWSDGANWQVFSERTTWSCNAYHSTTQTIATTTPTGLNLDSEDDDPRGMHDPASNNSRVVAVRPGRYNIFGRTVRASGGTSNGNTRLAKNGSNLRNYYFESSSVASTLMEWTALGVKLAANDYIEIIAAHNAATSTVYGSATADDATRIEMQWIGY